MSYKALLDLAIFIEKFRNIDLYQQGLYQIRFKIFYESNGHVTTTPGLQSAHIIEEKSIFCTKTFFIKYTEEEIEIDEGCLFRIEIDAYPEYIDKCITLECGLFHADVEISYPKGYTDILNFNKIIKDFEQISQFRGQVNKVNSGLNEYFPIYFDQEHFCFAQAHFHSVLIDFKFRHVHSIDISKEYNDTENNLKVIEKGVDDNPGVEIIKNLLAKIPNNFTEFLGLVTQNYQTELLQQFAQRYIQGLKFAQNKLFKQQVELLKCSKQTDHKQPQEIDNELNQLTELLNQDIKIEFQKKLENTEENKEHQTNTQTITLYLDQNNIHQTTTNILVQINQIAGDLLVSWHKFIELMSKIHGNYLPILINEYHYNIREKWGHNIFRQEFQALDYFSPLQESLKLRNKYVANKLRSSVQQSFFNETLCIEDDALFSNQVLQPIFFEEVYIKNIQDSMIQPQTKSAIQGAHLYVFVHGFQGNSYDLCLIRNYLLCEFPDNLYLLSVANEDDSNCDIQQMGQKLAKEVENYIKNWCPKSALSKITFVCYSLGGLIGRAALPYLEQYSDKMKSFITISSPHLGYMYSSSKLVDAGLWFLKKWKKNICLDQLTMSDSKNIEDTFLMKLSNQRGLEWFNNLIFISSNQDTYVPYESARICVSKDTLKDKQFLNLLQFSSSTKKQEIYTKMIKNIMGPVKAHTLHRLDVSFHIELKNLDSFIGRTAHLLFLENQHFIRMFINYYRHILE